MKIGQVAAEAEVTVDTVRFYERHTLPFHGPVISIIQQIVSAVAQKAPVEDGEERTVGGHASSQGQAGLTPPR